MAGPRQPIELVIANGKKHLTKEEIAQRRASEVQPAADDITAPKYLTSAQRRHFEKLAAQLDKIKIMGETDVDTLARYVVAETQYQAAVKEQRRLQKERPERDDYPEPGDYYHALELWYAMVETADKQQERYFKQASVMARDLGLTISSRCKLQVPVQEEAPKVNKFSQFGAIQK